MRKRVKRRPVDFFEIKRFQILRRRKLKRYVSFREAYFGVLKGVEP